jgi:methylated-DNA-[protein]-cysteine S-methyltransferase
VSSPSRRAPAGAPLLYTTLSTPIGELLLVGDRAELRGLYMQEGRKPGRVGPGWRPSSEAFEEPVRQLEQYFAGERRVFDLALATNGTPFQRAVWRALRDIPYGETISYRELARRIGKPSAVRAVGTANGANPISVIVPCHRVIGADGSLTGYGGGIERKRLLIALETQASAIRHGR